MITCWRTPQYARLISRGKGNRRDPSTGNIRHPGVNRILARSRRARKYCAHSSSFPGKDFLRLEWPLIALLGCPRRVYQSRVVETIYCSGGLIVSSFARRLPIRCFVLEFFCDLVNIYRLCFFFCESPLVNFFGVFEDYATRRGCWKIVDNIGHYDWIL